MVQARSNLRICEVCGVSTNLKRGRPAEADHMVALGVPPGSHRRYLGELWHVTHASRGLNGYRIYMYRPGKKQVAMTLKMLRTKTEAA